MPNDTSLKTGEQYRDSVFQCIYFIIDRDSCRSSCKREQNLQKGIILRLTEETHAEEGKNPLLAMTHDEPSAKSCKALADVQASFAKIGVQSTATQSMCRFLLAQLVSWT